MLPVQLPACIFSAEIYFSSFSSAERKFPFLTFCKFPFVSVFRSSPSWYAAQRLSYESWRVSSKKCREYKWTEESQEIQIGFLRDVSSAFLLVWRGTRCLGIHHRSLGIRGPLSGCHIIIYPMPTLLRRPHLSSENWLLETNGGMDTVTNRRRRVDTNSGQAQKTI